MNILVALPIAIPVAAAAAALLVHLRLRLQRILSVGAVAGATAAAALLLVHVERSGTAVVSVGGWEPPVGIVLVADLFSALLLLVAMITVLAVLVFALGQLERAVEERYFHPLYLVLTVGVSASFLTGDLFNLFVAFEVMLIASYVLLTLTGRSEQVRPAMTYVVVSLLSSTLFITGIALVYAATGTVNMADLGQRLADVPGALRAGLAALFLVVFGIKAAIFPLFFWLPDSYPTAPAAVTAVFAGLLTKIGVYAIIRTQTVVFGSSDGGADTLILFLAGATMLVGVLGAIAQDDVKRILSFHIVSQIGYMVFGLGLFSVAGLAATTVFIIHHMPVKTSLFLVGGIVEKVTGTGALTRLGGMVHRIPMTAGLFMVPALSLAGLPPFSGFYGKLGLVQAGIQQQRFLVVAVSLLVSVLTLFSMAKIWTGVFWGDVDQPEVAAAPAKPGRTVPRLMTTATVGLVGVTVVIALAAEPLFQLSRRAAADLIQPGGYIEAVLGAAR
ncbi:MAG: Na+/H+ antiporter subunit D [Nitriliruptorales bacterium]|nr:Na+/H+ antiporter subunit D [Nitriliruptorales bacterium]